MVQNKILFILSISFFATLFLTGCSSTSPRHLGPAESYHPNVIMAQVFERLHSFQSLEASGSIAVETPTFSNSGSIEIQLKKPDSLYFNIEGPFGIQVASAMVTRDTFLLYNSFKNQLLYCSTSRKNLGSLLQMDVDFSDIINLFGGVTLLGRESEMPSDYYVGDDAVVMIFKKPGGISKYWIDPENSTVSRIQILKEDGQIQKDILFSQYKLIDSIWIPFKMKINDLNSQKSVTFVYSKARANLKSVSFHFTIPDQAEYVEWR